MSSSWFRRRDHHRPGRPGAEGLRVEPLEDRLLLSTYLVTNTNDDGDGSLRQAILNVNASSGGDTIAFAIGAGGAQAIAPLSALPVITEPVTIDGTTQPGYAGSPLIELDGTSAGSGVSGLEIVAGGSTVRGLVIDSFAFGEGVVLRAAGGNTIVGNYLGTDPTGTVPRGNLDGLVLLDSGDNTIGGTTGAARNVIAGNGDEGLRIAGAGSNLVQGNYIGVDATGAAALGNVDDGVDINGSTNNTIGGTDLFAGNVVSGNGGTGVHISDSGSRGNLVQGNFVGTDASGTVALGNREDGVAILSASGNTLGGTDSGATNVVSGNAGSGVNLLLGAAGNLVQGNWIGLDSTGGAALGNGGDGVTVSGGGAVANTIGGTDDGAGNKIAFNGHDGVLVDGATRTGVLGNAIFSSTHLGIELINNGNNLQAAPVLSSATSGGGTTTVQGTLVSTPNTTFTLELFADTTCNPSGFGDGEQLLGRVTVTTDASGTATFSATFDTEVPVGQFLSATATDTMYNTSQFSQCLQVTG